MVKTYMAHTQDAAAVLGAQIAAGRRARQWTLQMLAKRANVSEPTVRKAERGDPSVALGTALELAVLVGVPLFGTDAAGAGALRDRIEARIALLPGRVDLAEDDLDDDF